MSRQPTESLDEGRITFDPPSEELPCFDPVCGRKVDATSTSAPKLDHDGKEYAFCSPACRARFQERPDDYNSERHA